MGYVALIIAVSSIFAGSLASAAEISRAQGNYNEAVALSVMCIKAETTKLAPSMERAELIASIAVNECKKYIKQTVNAFVLLNVSAESPDEMNNFYVKAAPLVEEAFKEEALKSAVRAKARFAD